RRNAAEREDRIRLRGCRAIAGDNACHMRTVAEDVDRAGIPRYETLRINYSVLEIGVARRNAAVNHGYTDVCAIPTVLQGEVGVDRRLGVLQPASQRPVGRYIQNRCISSQHLDRT